jgi:hypothetical protein
VNFVFRDSGQTKEFAVYTRAIIEAPGGWGQDSFLPEALVVDSGSGFAQEFHVEGFAAEGFPSELLKDETMRSALAQTVLTAFYRAKQHDYEYSHQWKLALDRQALGVDSHDISAREAIQRGRRAADISPTYIPVPVPATSEMALLLQMGQLSRLSELSDRVERLVAGRLFAT